MSLIGFGKDVEKKLIASTSPFVFSTVNEHFVLRILKLIDCDNDKIGTYAKLVKDRNQTAHPNGHIFFSTQAALDMKITEILRVVEEIQTHSKPVIERCYREFLLHSHDHEERNVSTTLRHFGEYITVVSSQKFSFSGGLIQTASGRGGGTGLPLGNLSGKSAWAASNVWNRSRRVVMAVR